MCDADLDGMQAPRGKGKKLDAAANWRPKEIRPGDVDVGSLGLLTYLQSIDLDKLLLQEKALIFRGFQLSAETYEDTCATLLPNCRPYVHGNSPRTKVGHNIYTSTEYPAEQMIWMHSEMSYSSTWPSRIMFICDRAPATGGATPVLDTQLWLQSIDDEVRMAFADGICYTQNLHDGIGLGKSWQVTFETDDRNVVEAWLEGTSAEWAWKPDGGLRISQVRPATLLHPVVGTEHWFNQADQFHVAGIDDDPATVAAIMSEDLLPQSVFFADGSPIPVAFVRHIQETGLRLSCDVDWQVGDVLLIDNIAVAHGRRPFTGDRRILVAMSD
jgi:alpha-ketoglutarate-dependent taurine dioxygenase